LSLLKKRLARLRCQQPPLLNARYVRSKQKIEIYVFKLLNCTNCTGLLNKSLTVE